MYRFLTGDGLSASPIFLSSPHSGTDFPEEIEPWVKPDLLKQPPDTDWWQDELYQFCTDLGMSQISAKWSRYVIDLNRDPESKSLYADGRIESGLLPTKTFSGEGIYRNGAPFLNVNGLIHREEIVRRREAFYRPYYERISSELDQLRKRFSRVLLFDCHSIKSRVPSLSPEPFPQMILGNNDGKSCSHDVLEAAAHSLQQAGWEVAVNHPFKGGHITRHFGSRDDGIEALQLEMCQSNYMDEIHIEKVESRFLKLQKDLKGMLSEVADVLKKSGKEL